MIFKPGQSQCPRTDLNKMFLPTLPFLILPYKSQIFWTFLALHFECTKLHLIFNDWQVGWTQIIHNKLSLGAHMCTSEIFDPFSNMGQ